MPPGLHHRHRRRAATYLADRRLPAGLVDEIGSRLADLETAAGKTFGGGPVPLLLSVRSGAPISMPGMMDTVLNLGLCRESAVAAGRATGDARFVADVVARFHAMYAEIVLGALDHRRRGGALVESVDRRDDPGAVYDRVWAACEQALADDAGERCPPTRGTSSARGRGGLPVLEHPPRPHLPRLPRHPHDLGTAVVVQSMVFGNLADDSGPGSCSPATRSPANPGCSASTWRTARARTSSPASAPRIRSAGAGPGALLAELAGRACARSNAPRATCWTSSSPSSRSVLYLLQVRSAKRTPEAAVRIAADLVADGTGAPARGAARGVRRAGPAGRSDPGSTRPR